MKVLKASAVIFSLSLVMLALSPQLRADEYNKKTILTFSQPVEIPGGVGTQVLPAGTYVFKLVDVLGNRDIVQIMNKEETKVYATVLAIPNSRMRPTGKTVVTFRETGQGNPEALRGWFYPGDIDGQEFVYPKHRAVELAKANNQPVLTMPEPQVAENQQPAPPTAETLKQTPLTSTQPSGEETEMAAVIPPAAPQNQTPTLPHTASPVPLIALIGLLSVGGSLGLSLAAKRVS
jgi:hypothetical protein